MTERAERTVGLLPARGGSKRIPRKNIKPLLGVPMIARTIATMADAGVFDHVVVSTDDDEVAAVATAAGAEVPFRRPAHLSDDHTGTGAVVRHALDELERLGRRPTHLCLVYPAAVFAEADDFRDALARLRSDPDLQYVFSATTYAAPIERALRIGPDGRVVLVHPDHLMTRSQDLPEHYHDVGQFYWGRRDAWADGVPVLAGRSAIHHIPRHRVQDIDDQEDWARAEALLRVTGRA